MKRPVTLLFLLVAVTAHAQVGEELVGPWHPVREHTAVRASGAGEHFDATYYHLHLDVRFQPSYLHGETLVQGRATGPLDVLRLDLSSNLTVDSVLAEGGGHLAFSHSQNLLNISLPDPLTEGQSVAVRVFYQGLPAQTGFGSFVFGTRANGDPFVWTLSQPYGAREWWPGVDHPTDKADSVRVSVTVPDSLLAGSNGLIEADVVADGRRTVTWVHRYPIASYLVSMAAGVYEERLQTYTRPPEMAADWGELELPVLHYVFRGHNAYEGTSVASGWHRVLDVMRVMEEWFGPYPFPEEKYGHKHVTFGGGMEHQTMSSMGGASVGLITHELAHQWYGDLITNRYWPELWLNEGFATYAELLYWEARRDLYGQQFENARNLYMARARNAPGTLIVQDTLSISNLFNSNRVYAKGGMVLHMLRGMTGDETFRQILRTYSYDPQVRYGTAVTADFRRVAEQVSGRDLDRFFEQWVTQGTGYPVYEVYWSYAEADGGGYDVSVQVHQIQNSPQSNVAVFEMPVMLEVVTDGDTVRETVMNTGRSESFLLHVAEEPVGVRFDPDHWLLRNEPVTIVPAERTTIAPDTDAIVNFFPNPASAYVRLTVSISQSGPVRIELFDALGRRVGVLFQRELAGGYHPVELSVDRFAAGSYFLRFTTPRAAITRPLVILPR
jgi:aminopeptidase N